MRYLFPLSGVALAALAAATGSSLAGSDPAAATRHGSHRRRARTGRALDGTPRIPARRQRPRASLPPTWACCGRQQVAIDGTVDASAIYLHGATVNGARARCAVRDDVVRQDAGHRRGRRHDPLAVHAAGLDALAGSRQVTTSTPVADPGREFIYAASPDGHVQKLAVEDGHALWSTAITSLPQREKIASPLNYARGHVIATTGGYIGDAPPYQGHVALLDARVASCSSLELATAATKPACIDPTVCSAERLGDLGPRRRRDRHDHRQYLRRDRQWPLGRAHQLGRCGRRTRPDAAQMLANYTPRTPRARRKRRRRRLDVARAARRRTCRAGREGRRIRLLDLSQLRGGERAQGRRAAEASARRRERNLFTAPAVLHGAHRHVDVRGRRRRHGCLDAERRTRYARCGRTATAARAPSSPAVSSYVYNPHGGLLVYEATTGKCAGDARVLVRATGTARSWPAAGSYLPEGSSNDHRANGVIDIRRLPSNPLPVPLPASRFRFSLPAASRFPPFPSLSSLRLE